ncbi:MAG: hypothetical protein ACO1OQ_09180 [Rufibacter sp.]
MTHRDLLIKTLHSKVGHFPEPQDHPTSVSEVAAITNLPELEILTTYEELAEEGFVLLSPIGQPPLVYLTLTGLSRAKRL